MIVQAAPSGRSRVVSSVWQLAGSFPMNFSISPPSRSQTASTLSQTSRQGHPSAASRPMTAAAFSSGLSPVISGAPQKPAIWVRIRSKAGSARQSSHRTPAGKRHDWRCAASTARADLPMPGPPHRATRSPAFSATAISRIRSARPTKTSLERTP